MSELPPGSMSLEVEENPVAEAPPAPETPAQAPEAPQQAADQDPDGTIEGSGGVKFVPLGAVVDLRGKVREKETALAAKDAEIAALRDKAAKFDQVAGEWQAAQPLLQAVRNGTYQPVQPPQKPAGPLSAQEAIEYAKDLDLYKQDGTPDVDRAQRLAARQASLAEAQAKAIVAPIYQNSAQQQSVANYHAMASHVDKSGVKVDPAILQNVWSQVPAELSCQKGVADVLYRFAYAETIMQGKHKLPGPAPAPPQFTESLGGNTPAPKELTAMDRGMMSAANITTKDYETISANFKPGQRNVLE